MSNPRKSPLHITRIKIKYPLLGIFILTKIYDKSKAFLETKSQRYEILH